jgi:hypothetical protein
MKPLLFLSVIALLAACGQSPTAPSTQSNARPTVAVVLAGSTLSAAKNPAGSGQPTQSCQDQLAAGGSQPNGFNTDGFMHATVVYAGSNGTPSLANGNSHAVSQYDVACFQLSNK